MTTIDDFSKEARNGINEHIHQPFPDALPWLELFFNGLTRNQLIFFEQYWREYGPSTPEREMWETLKWAPERRKVYRRPSIRSEVVFVKGHRVKVWRDLRTGRFVRRRRTK